MQNPFASMGMVPKRPKQPEKVGKFGEAYNKYKDVKKKYGVYINYIIFYGWVPIVIYRGLKNGTHKYLEETAQGPRPQARKPRVGDLLPIIGSHGLP